MDLGLEEMTEEMMAMTDLGGIYFMLNYFFFCSSQFMYFIYIIES